MAKYSLVGVNGNAYALMGYTAKAMKREGLADEVDEMLSKAKSGNYSNLICVCNDYVEKCNEIAEQNGTNDEDID